MLFITWTSGIIRGIWHYNNNKELKMPMIFSNVQQHWKLKQEKATGFYIEGILNHRVSQWYQLQYVIITFPFWKWNGIINEEKSFKLFHLENLFQMVEAVLRIRDVYLRSRIRLFSIPDPASEFFPSRIPDPQQRI